MEGQKLGGRSFRRTGDLLHNELVGIPNVGVMSRQDIRHQASGYQGGQHLCMPQHHHHMAQLNALQHHHVEGRARIVGAAPHHPLERRMNVHGAVPHVYQSRSALNTSLGAPQHMLQRGSRGIAPQTATCISRSPGGNMPMMACASSPYALPMSYQPESSNSLLRQGAGMHAVPRPMALSGSAMCNAYQHFPEQLGDEHGRLLDGVQIQSHKVHPSASAHVQNGANTVSIVEVSGAPLVSKTLNQPNMSYNSPVLVRDDTGVFQLVSVDKKNTCPDINTINYAENQRAVFGSRPHNGDFNHAGNPVHTRALSLEMRSAQNNVAWEAHLPHHKNLYQQTSFNHGHCHQQHMQHNLGSGLRLDQGDDARRAASPICIETDSQDDASLPPTTPTAQRKEDVIEMDLEDTCAPAPEGPTPSPAAVDIADQSLSEADVVLAAQSLKELSNTVPCVKASDGPNNESEDKQYNAFDGKNKERKISKGLWGPLDLLLDAAARMEVDFAKVEKCRTGGRNCVHVAESSTRMRSKRMRGIGYRKSHVYSAVLNHTYREETSTPSCFQSYEGLRGVTSTKKGKFIARCRYRGSAVQIGVFECARDASKAYDRFILALRGPTATTNHPQGDYLAFEIETARNAFEKMSTNVRECPRVRRGSCHSWNKEAKRLKSDGNRPSIIDGEEPFDSQVRNIEAVLSRMESSNPKAFQVALEKVQGSNDDILAGDMLLQSASQPWNLLKQIGEKRLCLEDALSSIEKQVEENCNKSDNSQSDCLLCTADMLRAVASVWKVWKGGSLSWAGPGDSKLNPGRNNQEDTLRGHHPNKRCKAEKGSEEGTVKRSKFLHHLRNDIHSHLEDTNLDDEGKKHSQLLELREESDVSSKPSSWDDHRMEDRDSKRPIIISGGRVRGSRPAPRRGTGRKAPTGRIQNIKNERSCPFGADFDQGRKGTRKRKSFNNQCTKLRKEFRAHRAIQAGFSSDNTTRNWENNGNQLSEENTDVATGSRSGGSRDSMVHVNVSEVQLTTEVEVHNERLNQSAEEQVLQCKPQLESLDDSLGGSDFKTVHTEDIQNAMDSISSKSNHGPGQGAVQTHFDKTSNGTAATMNFQDGNQSMQSYADDKEHHVHTGLRHAEEGVVRIYGSQLAVQQLKDPDGEDAKNMSSMVEEEPCSDQLLCDRDMCTVDSVQWARLLASSLWPKKRGGGMLNKAFNANCSGCKYRETILDIRNKMCERSRQENP